jgi:uncharacterized membrane protein
MDAYWWGTHMFAWMWIFPLSFLVVYLFFLFAFLFRNPGSFCAHRDRRDFNEAAREILGRRYAGGEISREQYEEMRQVLLG